MTYIPYEQRYRQSTETELVDEYYKIDYWLRQMKRMGQPRCNVASGKLRAIEKEMSRRDISLDELDEVI